MVFGPFWSYHLVSSSSSSSSSSYSTIIYSLSGLFSFSSLALDFYPPILGRNYTFTGLFSHFPPPSPPSISCSSPIVDIYTRYLLTVLQHFYLALQFIYQSTSNILVNFIFTWAILMLGRNNQISTICIYSYPSFSSTLTRKPGAHSD